MSNKVKKKIFYIILIIGITILTVVGSEIVIRLLSVLKLESATLIYDPLIDWRMRPHTRPYPSISKTNSFGFNDYEHNYSKAKGNNYRVAFVGDSFTFGVYDYEKNFPFIVQDLGRQNGLNLESINFGVPGSSPKQYLKMVNTYVRKAKPNLVIVTLFIGNDIYQSDPNLQTQLWLGSVGSIPKLTHIGFDKESFALYTVLRSLYRYRLHKYFAEDENVEGFHEQVRLNLEYQYHDIFRKQLPEKVKRQFLNLQKILKKISYFIDSFEGDLLVVLAPTEIQINDELRKSFLSKYSIHPSNLNISQPQQIIIQYLNNLNIKYIDLLPAFLEEGDKKILYAPGDTHFNEDGNYLAAEIIFNTVNALYNNSVSIP
jgi:lysophospholipase L1-like esterase